MTAKKLTQPHERYMTWDIEKKHPFAANLYFANADKKKIYHANTLFMGYNCEIHDLTHTGSRVVCNTIEEINEALSNPPHKAKHFRIITPLGWKGELKQLEYPDEN